ncbi:MAG: inositol monophosphatase family protein, partial [Actinomycetota bacterium]
MPVDADAILSLAVDLATQAAAVHADGRKSMLRVEEKGSPFSLVTQVDREAERVIVDGIRAARPDDEILGEEGTSVPGRSGVRWLVDPVDGTTNYVYGYAAYSVSIGVEIDGQPAVGVVFDTGRDVLYAAVRGRG